MREPKGRGAVGVGEGDEGKGGGGAAGWLLREMKQLAANV